MQNHPKARTSIKKDEYHTKCERHDLFPGVLFRAARAWRMQLDKRLKPLGLSHAKWHTLLHIARAKEPLNQQTLANRIGIESPTLVGLIDRMEKDGWVIRLPDPSDRRGKKIHLTPKAKKTVQVIRKVSDALKNELLLLLPKHEIDACLSALKKIKEALDSL